MLINSCCTSWIPCVRKKLFSSHWLCERSILSSIFTIGPYENSHDARSRHKTFLYFFQTSGCCFKLLIKLFEVFPLEILELFQAGGGGNTMLKAFSSRKRIRRLKKQSSELQFKISKFRHRNGFNPWKPFLRKNSSLALIARSVNSSSFLRVHTSRERVPRTGKCANYVITHSWL